MDLPRLPDITNTPTPLPDEMQSPYEITIQYARSMNKRSGWLNRKLSSGVLFYFLYMTAYMVCFQLLGKLFSMPVTMTISMLVVALFFLRLCVLAAAPQRIQVGQDGIRFQWLYSWPFTFGGSSKWIDWSKIDSISLKDQKNGKQHVEIAVGKDDFRLAFQHLFSTYCALILQLIGVVKNSGSSTNFIIDVDGIFHEPDKAKFYSALTHFASFEQLSPSVAALQPIGYTKVWLREFSKDIDPHNNLIDPLAVGTKLADGNFEILRQLGSGGQSLTYVAKVIKNDTDALGTSNGPNSDIVVLKEFVLPVRAGIEIKRRALRHIENEARLLQSFDHQQIVKYIDSFVSGQRAYLVLEYVAGTSLRKLIQASGAFREEETAKIALSMCSILEYLHSLKPPIIHRDFTPENLLLNNNNKLMLIDFNVAQQQESVNTKTFVGKHNYFPPEQFRGNATTQSDIYACGGCIYWLCTGQDPSPLSVSHPQRVNPTISAKLDAVVAKATALSLTERYKTIQELKHDLQYT